MLLQSVLSDLAVDRPISRVTHYQYDLAIRRYSRYIGHAASVEDLAETTVSQWLADESRSVAPRTVANLRRGLLAVWNYASGRDLAPWYNVRRIRKIRVPQPMPQAFSPCQVRQLLDACGQLAGRTRCGIAASDLMRAWCMVAYDTGLRPVDQLRLRRSNIDGQVVRIVQHKTGIPHVCSIRPATATAIARTFPPARERIFPFGKWGLRRWELLLRKVSGIRLPKGIGIGHLRHTHGTLVAELYGLEQAAKSLGHASGVEIARRHYVVHTAAEGHLPPDL